MASQALAKSPFCLKQSKISFYQEKKECVCKIGKYLPEIKTQVLGVRIEPIVSKNEILNCLIKLESSGIETKINPHDTDGNPRYGLLQYYLPTWYEWCVGKYNLPDEILNGNVQLECATRMIFEDKQGWRWPPLKKCL